MFSSTLVLALQRPLNTRPSSGSERASLETNTQTEVSSLPTIPTGIESTCSSFSLCTLDAPGRECMPSCHKVRSLHIAQRLLVERLVVVRHTSTLAQERQYRPKYESHIRLAWWGVQWSWLCRVGFVFFFSIYLKIFRLFLASVS